MDFLNDFFVSAIKGAGIMAGIAGMLGIMDIAERIYKWWKRIK